MKIISVRDPSKKQRKFILGAFRKGEPFGFVLHLIRFIQPTDCASIVNRTNFLTMSGIKCTQVYFKFAKTVLQLYFLYFVANVKVIMQSYLLRRKGRILKGANYHYAHTKQKHPLNVNHYPYPVTEKESARGRSITPVEVAPKWVSILVHSHEWQGRKKDL